MKSILIAYFFCSLISFIGFSQSDTNHLYLDYLELDFADSSEKLISIVLYNESNVLLFTDTSQTKLIGINRTKSCDLKIHTNKSILTLENIKEYISFTETKYRISVFMPINHVACIYATCIRPDGLILLHSQTMKQMDFCGTPDNCVVVNAAPTGYSRFDEFEVNFILE